MILRQRIPLVLCELSTTVLLDASGKEQCLHSTPTMQHRSSKGRGEWLVGIYNTYTYGRVLLSSLCDVCNVVWKFDLINRWAPSVMLLPGPYGWVVPRLAACCCLVACLVGSILIRARLSFNGSYRRYR